MDRGGQSAGTQSARPPCAGYSFLQGPSTCMVRPHPGFWRIVHGVIIIYLLALVFLLFQNVDDARHLLKVGLCTLCFSKAMSRSQSGELACNAPDDHEGRPAGV